jgi:hypothetical protein
VLAVTVAVEVPVSFTVAPFPPAPEIVPEMVNTCTAEVKFAVTLAVVIVTALFVGVNVYPDLAGVTVYAPATRVEKVYTPEEFAVVVAVAAPVRVTVAPFPPAPLIVPERVNTGAELKLAVTFAVVMVTFWVTGVKTYPPALVGVTV